MTGIGGVLPRSMDLLNGGGSINRDSSEVRMGNGDGPAPKEMDDDEIPDDMSDLVIPEEIKLENLRSDKPNGITHDSPPPPQRVEKAKP